MDSLRVPPTLNNFPIESIPIPISNPNPVSSNSPEEINKKLRDFVFDEINYRIINLRDKKALEILAEAKRKLKESIESHKETIAFLIAMKGFYLVASISLMSLSPASV